MARWVPHGNRNTGLWEDVYTIGRSDMALVRSLRDRSRLQEVAVRMLIVHDDLGLWREPTQYPTLPNAQRLRQNRAATSIGGQTAAL
jgi:hypothetical protein